jgi:hypothetical protein
MTTFRRRAHYRTSPSGEYVEVGDQWVTRNDWSRRSDHTHPQATSPRDPVLVSYPELRYAQTSKSACSTARYLNPNARCPACGDPVFYYQNEHGSRVFFDEIGPPWPRHPCTSRFEITGRNLSPRTEPDVSEISAWLEGRGKHCDEEFRQKYGHNPWQIGVITMRLKRGRCVFLVLKPIKATPAKDVYASAKSLPRFCREGLPITIKKKKISFINPATLEPMEVSIDRYRGASAFINAMAAFD